MSAQHTEMHNRLALCSLAFALTLLLSGCFPNTLPLQDLPDSSSITVQPITRQASLPVIPADDDAKTLAVAVADASDPRRARAFIRPHAAPLAPSRIHRVYATLAKLGIGSDQISVIAPVDGPQDSFDVLITHYVVIPPNCDNMMRRSEMISDSRRPSFGFGCATLNNLSNMVDDPGDLVRGRTYGGADGARESGAVRRYEENQVTPLNRSMTTR